MDINFSVKEMIEEFSKIEEVEGIMLAGSYAAKTNDKYSDYDIYIYSFKELPVEKRKAITDVYCSYMELNNIYWETEDDGFMKENNIAVEIIYRDLSWMDSTLERTVIKCCADIGYTTCFWANFVNSIILYDKDGKLSALQSKYGTRYPEKLKENVIRKNYPLLKSEMFSYYNQIDKAIKREDIISVNHRVAALFASYFDIIFAVNEILHPGEKKLLKIIKDSNLKVPGDMDENIENVLRYSSSNNGNILTAIALLVHNLDNLLKAEGLFYLCE